MVQEIAYHPRDVLKTLNEVEKNQDEFEKYLEKMEEKIKVTEQHLLSEEIEEINELEDKVADHKLDYAITGDGQEDLLKTIYTTLMSVNTQLNETNLASEKIIGPSKRRQKKWYSTNINESISESHFDCSGGEQVYRWFISHIVSVDHRFDSFVGLE